MSDTIATGYLRARDLSSLSRTERSVLDRLDFEHIEMAAAWAAEQLTKVGFASVVLTPGDATRYPISIRRSSLAWPDFNDRGGSYVVSYESTEGRAYQWNGQYLSPDYVEQKWAERPWSAIVLTEFLMTLRDFLPKAGE